MTPLLVALLLASNGSGKTLVRTNPGTTVPISVVSGPLILDDAGTVAHVTFTGAALLDSKGNAWTMNGTVPQVAKSGKTPAGAGNPFSDVNYYSLGTGSDVADFTGDFSVCVVYQSSVLFTTSGQGIVANGDNSGVNTGYGIFGGSGNLIAAYVGSATPIDTGNAVLTGYVSVSCMGRASTTAVSKTNLGTYRTAAATATAATTAQLRLGKWQVDTVPFKGTLYEAWFSSTTPSDALFTQIMQRVKARAGVTAW